MVPGFQQKQKVEARRWAEHIPRPESVAGTGNLEGRCVFRVDDSKEDSIAVHFMEEDLQKFEDAERETQEKLQMHFSDEKEVDLFKEHRDTMCESHLFSVKCIF